MCQLFGISTKKEQDISLLLKEFYSHSISTFNKDGWGLAKYSKTNKLTLFVKETNNASRSDLCKVTCSDVSPAVIAIAHIRKSSRGIPSQENSHPFTHMLNGKEYVFAHNGTVDYKGWNNIPFKKYQPVGQTDSEKIFCTLIDDLSTRENMSDDKLYSCIEESILKMLNNKAFNSKASGKMNFLFSDGERLFEFCNCEKTLYKAQKEGVVIFCTEPLNKNKDLIWDHVELGALNVYKNGELIYKNKFLDDKSIIKKDNLNDYVLK